MRRLNRITADPPTRPAGALVAGDRVLLGTPITVRSVGQAPPVSGDRAGADPYVYAGGSVRIRFVDDAGRRGHVDCRALLPVRIL